MGDLPRVENFNITGRMRFDFLAALVVYFIVLLAGSALSRKKQRGLEDFFLASRKLSPLLVYFSVSASWIGAVSMLVSADEALANGISSFWIMGLPAGVTVLIFAFVLARPIRRVNILSLPDLVEKWYGREVRHITALLIIWYMILLAASQMVALGRFLQPILGTSYIVSLGAGVGVVLLYSLRGGFSSVVITDSIQFVLLGLGVIGLFVFISERSSFVEVSTLASQFELKNYFNFFSNIKENVLIFISFTLAWTISPITWQRIQAARSEKAARSGLLGSAGTLLVFYMLVISVGMMSLPLLSSRNLGEPLFSVLIRTDMNIFLGILLFVGITAAVMSTMDTAINTGALSLTRDVFDRLFGLVSHGKSIRWSRLATLIVGIAAFLIATRFRSILQTLGLASEIMAEGLFIPGIAMLFLRRKMPRAGLFSLVMGGGYSFLGFLAGISFLPWSWPSWPYSVPLGLGCGAAGFIIGAVIDLNQS